MLFKRQETPYSSTHKSHVIFLVGIYGLWNYSKYFLDERELEMRPNNREIDISKRGENGHFSRCPKPLVTQNGQKKAPKLRENNLEHG